MDEQKIQRLMQLKRYECPPVNAVENFIEEFQRRQRAELLRPSLLELIQERLAKVIAEFQVPKMAYVLTTVTAVLVSLFILRSENFIGADRGFLNPPASYQTSSGGNQDAFPVTIQRATPMTLDINSSDRDDDSVVFPLSYILEKSHTHQRSPLVF